MCSAGGPPANARSCELGLFFAGKLPALRQTPKASRAVCPAHTKCGGKPAFPEFSALSATVVYVIGGVVYVAPVE